MHDKLITLSTFDNSFQAHLMKTKLEDAGIMVYIFDENIITLNPLFSNVVGGIKLKIHESDLGKAKEIVESVNNVPYTDEQDIIIRCPKCNSEQIETVISQKSNAKSIVALFVSLLTFTTPLYVEHTLSCKECKAEFKH